MDKQDWLAVWEVELDPKRPDFDQMEWRVCDLFDGLGQHLRALGFHATAQRDLTRPIYQYKVLIWGQHADVLKAQSLVPELVKPRLDSVIAGCGAVW